MKQTINGKEVTEEQIASWAAEAERGYDVESLRSGKRGRPGRGAMPSQVIAVRLTQEELELIDKRAADLQISRSDYIRRMLTA